MREEKAERNRKRVKWKVREGERAENDEGSESISDQDTQIKHLTLIRADNSVTIAMRRGCREE